MPTKPNPIPAPLTPLGQDDRGNTLEDARITIDVLANDFGGSAKQLFSVNQTNPAVVSTKATSSMGAAIEMVDGQVSYDGSAASKIQTLGAGATATDTFTYVVRLANGTVSSATVSVALTGSNDMASISGTASGSTAEDGSLSTGGVLSVSDVDSGENTFGTIGSLTGAYGTFTFDQGKWGYALDNTSSKVQTLAGGAIVYDTLTVASKDNTASQEIKITIGGTNDKAAIAGGASGSVKEDGILTAGGTLAVSDVDAGENTFGTIGSLAGTYGTFTFDNGKWAYTLDNTSDKVQALAGNDTVHDTLTVSSKDNTASQEIKVSISGADNDTPTVQRSEMDVLILGSSGGMSQVAQALQPYGFKSVDARNAFLAVDPLSLDGYEVVVAYTNGVAHSSFADTLKTYVDRGGTLVLSTYAFSDNWSLSGGIMQPGYSPLLNPAPFSNGSVSGRLAATVPNDPLFEGLSLSTLTYWWNGNYAHPSLAPGAELLATDGQGHNMIARNGEGNIIGMNLFPENQSGQTHTLFANAVTLVGQHAEVG